MTHAGASHRDRSRAGVGAPRPSGSGPGEPGAATAADGAETHDQAPAPPDARPTVLDRLRSHLAELAHGDGPGAAGHGRAVASRLAPPPMDPTFDPPPDKTAVHRSIKRSASSSERWRRRTRCGERRGFMANCGHSVCTSQNARCRVCWSGTHVRPRKRGGRSSRITSRQPPRWISSPCRHSPVGYGSCWSCVTSPPVHRASQHHGSSDSHLGRSTSSRRVSR
jgi:hypothetical protein